MKNTSGLRQEVIEEMETLPQDQLRDVLRFIESLRQAPQSSRSIEEKIQAIVDDAPDEIWKNVPADGAEQPGDYFLPPVGAQHDHYIYGAPKKKS